jgi:putative hemolysin
MKKIMVLMALFVLSSASSAMLNPALSYCDAMGYDHFEIETKEGTKVVCVLPGKNPVDAWDFLRGDVGLEHSYCEKNGLVAKKSVNSPTCKFCTVCVQENGEEIEVTKLMGLSFRETTCGDGDCDIENHKTCPQDCPSGGIDDYCDLKVDGICDPDCEEGKDRDCKISQESEKPTTTCMPLLLFPVVGLISFFGFHLRNN